MLEMRKRAVSRDLHPPRSGRQACSSAGMSEVWSTGYHLGTHDRQGIGTRSCGVFCNPGGKSNASCRPTTVSAPRVPADIQRSSTGIPRGSDYEEPSHAPSSSGAAIACDEEY